MAVTLIPTPLAARAVADRNPRNAGTCGIWTIAGRLGQANRTVAYICKQIDLLIADHDFPAPFPTLAKGQLVPGAHPRAKWPLIAVDLWFADRLPPQALGQLGQAERVEIDSRLSGRAAMLFGGDAA